MRAWPRICAASGRPAPDSMSLVPAVRRRAWKDLPSWATCSMPARVRRRRMRVEPVEFPSFTNGALSRTNTSGASQSGRPCKIHSATALPASADSGSTSGLDVLAWTSRISSRRQSISSRRSATMSQHRSPVETASKTIA